MTGDGRLGGDPTVVRLGGPADILGVLPWRLGFHPRESVVVVCLEGPRKRDRLVMRGDLPAPGHEPAGAADLVGRVRRVGADAALVVVYTEAPPDPDGGQALPRAGFVDLLGADLARWGVELTDALLVRAGRWWSYLCANPRCCPPDGTPLASGGTEASVRYAAEAVGRGGVVRPDRDAVRRSVEPADHAVARTVRAQAMQSATALLRETLADGGYPAWRTLTLNRLWALRVRWDRGERGRPEPVDAAVVLLGLSDKQVRDRLVTAALDDDVESVIDLFTVLARQADDPFAAPVCTVLAWLAYSAGHGALATVALERAVRADPGYELARLLEAGMEAMVRPSLLRSVCAAVRADLSADEPDGPDEEGEDDGRRAG